MHLYWYLSRPGSTAMRASFWLQASLGINPTYRDTAGPRLAIRYVSIHSTVRIIATPTGFSDAGHQEMHVTMRMQRTS